MVGQLDPQRGAPGAYTAYLECDDGTPATIVYSGYGHFDMRELVEPATASQREKLPLNLMVESGALSDENAAKEALRNAGTSARNSLGLFGLTLVTCEHGDLRESAAGVVVYARGEQRLIEVQDELRGEAELRELYEAVRHGKPLIHDGRWGEDTLKVCLAIHESARTRTEILLD